MNKLTVQQVHRPDQVLGLWCAQREGER